LDWSFLLRLPCSFLARPAQPPAVAKWFDSVTQLEYRKVEKIAEIPLARRAGASRVGFEQKEAKVTKTEEEPKGRLVGPLFLLSGLSAFLRSLRFLGVQFCHLLGDGVIGLRRAGSFA
jgi:hypothetical protein